jgi:hypothetical protein
MRARLAVRAPVPVASYEELVGSPERVLRLLCEGLDIEFDPAMLAHEREERTQAEAAAAADWANLARPVFTSSVGSYRERLSLEEIRFVEATCREPMEQLGYAPDFEPLAHDDAEALRSRLAAAEPHEKRAYRSVSEEERAQRESFANVRRRIKSRPARSHRDLPDSMAVWP